MWVAENEAKAALKEQMLGECKQPLQQEMHPRWKGWGRQTRRDEAEVMSVGAEEEEQLMKWLVFTERQDDRQKAADPNAITRCVCQFERIQKTCGDMNLSNAALRQ